MKLWGYGNDKRQDKPFKLIEVTFQTKSPKQLREISKFLLEAAKLLEKKINFDHLHFRDENKNWKMGDPDFIVADEKRKRRGLVKNFGIYNLTEKEFQKISSRKNRKK